MNESKFMVVVGTMLLIFFIVFMIVLQWKNETDTKRCIEMAKLGYEQTYNNKCIIWVKMKE